MKVLGLPLDGNNSWDKMMAEKQDDSKAARAENILRCRLHGRNDRSKHHDKLITRLRKEGIERDGRASRHRRACYGGGWATTLASRYASRAAGEEMGNIEPPAEGAPKRYSAAKSWERSRGKRAIGAVETDVAAAVSSRARPVHRACSFSAWLGRIDTCPFSTASATASWERAMLIATAARPLLLCAATAQSRRP